MLTKSDLSAIQKIVDGSIQRETEPIKKDIKNIKSNQRGLNKTVNVMIDHFDRDRASLRKRVDNIEKHIGISNSSV